MKNNSMSLDLLSVIDPNQQSNSYVEPDIPRQRDGSSILAEGLIFTDGQKRTASIITIKTK